MTKELFLLANQSIAFNQNVVNHLNKKAIKIDSRLYLFAYYQPKHISEDINAHECFNIAVINMYGLLWDCGKMVLHQLFGSVRINKKPNIIQSLLIANKKSFEEFFSIIYNVRTCICHNNSDCFFYNREVHHKCQQYLENLTEVSCSNYAYDEFQWEHICQDFLERCKWFTDILNKFLDATIQETNLNKKAEIVNYWIGSILYWYQTDKELAAHVLADRFKLKSLSSSQKNTTVTKSRVTKWVVFSWKKKNPSLSQTKPKDCYQRYITTCFEKIPNILNSEDCPRPALPLEVFTKATLDAENFKIYNF